MKFKSDIEVQAGLKDSSGAAGTSGQVLSSDGTAVSWIDAEIGVARDVQNRVKAGVAINKGQAVYVTGADGTNIIVGLASNTSEATSSKTLGLLNATVATNGFADVIQIGKLTGLNTIGAIVGDPVWLGTNGNLIYGLANKPYAPAHLVYIGVVTRVNASNGEIFVTVQNGFELNEIHDVDLKTNIPISGDVLGYNGSLWVNKTIPGWLGYTPADDANVVKLTGNQTINGEKTFAGTIYSDNATYLKQYTSFSNQTNYTNIGGQPDGIYIGTTSAASTISMTNLTAFRFYELPDASGTIALTSDIHNPVTIGTGNGLYLTTIAGVPTQQLNLFLSTATQNGALSSTDWTTFNNKQNQLNGTGFVRMSGTTPSYITGNQDQYVKADGSLSTAMNSRIEVNFIATSGQTTFVTPYEVGQIDVYYNGSKLYPNEFTATNGTDIILATGAALNAQISIVKYVSSLSTTAIRNETTFTTTAGQTTFAVNYSPGQVDVFYNGSKLNISEFTATNGTSVILGFACAAGESIVIDSYVNQISGASGTTNYVSKFTGAASLGDSLIYDNGTNVGIATTTLSEKLNLDGNMLLRSQGAIKFNRADNTVSTNLYDAGSYFVLDNRNGNGFAFQSTGANVVNITSGGLLGVGTGLSGSARVNILNVASAPFLALRSTNNVYEIAKMSFDQSTDILSIVNNQGASSSGITFGTTGVERVRITAGGNLYINATSGTYASSGYALGIKAASGTQTFMSLATPSQTLDSQGLVFGLENTIAYLILRDNSPLTFGTNNTERMRITNSGNVCIGTTTFSALNKGIVINDASNCGIALRNNDVNKGYFYNNGNNIWLESTGGTIYAVAGSAGVYLANGAVAWLSNSDENLKTDLVPIEDAINKVCSLRSVIGRYKTDDVGKRRPFLIAQDVEKVLPEAVSKDVETGNLGVSYSEMIPLLVASIKEQQEQIQELKAEIEILKNK